MSVREYAELRQAAEEALAMVETMKAWALEEIARLEKRIAQLEAARRKP